MMLPDHCHRPVRVVQPDDVLTGRSIAAELAVGTNLTPVQQERFRLIVTELATNLLRHAPEGGTLLLRRLSGDQGYGGLECICYDRGPGIIDVAEALRDGETSSTGLGYGLGGIRRLSDQFEIHSEPTLGTAILSRVGEGVALPASRFQFGAVMVPMAGLDHCGDGWVCTAEGLVAVIDGLGHGAKASLAARRAEQCLAAPVDNPRNAILAMNTALIETRGAVVMAILATEEMLQFSGVGNISGTLIGIDKMTRLHSSWGVVGSRDLAPDLHELPWNTGDVIVLSSDGVSQAAECFAARRLRYCDPTLAASIILRDAAHKLDDQTVVVLRR